MRPDKSSVNKTLITASVHVVQYHVYYYEWAIPGTVMFVQTHNIEFVGELTLFPWHKMQPLAKVHV
jgi:hypothetical protein